jgi:hypothetical protein
MTDRVVIAVTVAVCSPFLFQALAGGLVGVDAAQLRDEDKNPVLPGTQLQGVLREALGDIAAVAPPVISETEITELFGRGSPEFAETGEYDRPERGRALVGDLVARSMRAGPGARDDPLPVAVETARIEIDDELGAARTGYLQVVELVAPFGAEVSFTGDIVLFWRAEDSARIIAAIDKALKLIPVIGAFKSAGFGEVLAERSSAALVTSRALTFPAAGTDTQERYGFAATFDRPILVDTDRVTDNAFVGAEIIPGAALKGALARKVELAGGSDALGGYEAALASLVISHALPADTLGHPAGEPFPLSIVAVAEEKNILFGDALRLAQPDGTPRDALGPMIGGEPAWFRPDWKGRYFEAVDKFFSRGDFVAPARLPRTHTAIEDGIAAEGQLYTAIARSTRDPANPKEPQCFLFTIDLCNVDEQQQAKARTLVALLRDGLDGIGRTLASAAFERWPAGDMALTAKPVAEHPGLFAVVLTTAAVLTDPRTALSARDAYAAYWAGTVPGARLVDFCASQYLAGGYLAMRRRPWRGTYHPFVVTTAGSVFLLAGDIGPRLDKLLRTGLPLPSFVEADPLDWRNCPFVPGNGYGAIRADHLSDERSIELSRRVTHV